MFKIKTPHRRPFRHMLNMWALFAGAVFAVMILHIGVERNYGSTAFPLLAAVATALTAGAISLVAGVAITATVRRALNLVQTGRLIQYSGFCLASWLGLQSAVYFFAAITVTVPALAAFTVFVLAFGTATALGEVPWRGRNWMPLRAKKAGPGSSGKTANSRDQDPIKKS